MITINAGAGGTESAWASMLMRMYLRFAERHDWSVDIFDLQDGDEAGIKSTTFEVNGEFAFGLLKAESGVHRLVRISPFDSNARRHTSFVSVFVSPVIDDSFDIELNEADIRVDTYRASGAGGQHINKTDSAVRMTHVPTGIVVQSQTQRSQHQNRDQCLKLLKSKLYEQELEKRRQAQAAVEGSKATSPGVARFAAMSTSYKMVKDHRTNYESRSPDDVLDGDIEEFINEFLAKAHEGKNRIKIIRLLPDALKPKQSVLWLFSSLKFISKKSIILKNFDTFTLSSYPLTRSNLSKKLKTPIFG